MGRRTKNGRRKPKRPPKRDTAAVPNPGEDEQQQFPPHIDPRLAKIGTENLDDDVDLMQQVMADRNFPVMAPDVGLTALDREERAHLIASMCLQPAVAAVAKIWSEFDVAMTTDWQTRRIEQKLVSSIGESWGRTLADRVAHGDALIIPRAVAQLIREIIESAQSEESGSSPSSAQIAHLLVSLNSEHNASEYSTDGTLDRETIARIQTEIFSLDAEQTMARLREYMPTEVATVLADAPLKTEIVQGAVDSTWNRAWPERVSNSGLGLTPSDAFATANGVALVDLQVLGQFILDGIKSGTLVYSRSDLEASGASVAAVDYCLQEMSAPLDTYRRSLAYERRQGPVQNQRFTMTRYPFLRMGSDTAIIALRYQWVLDRFFGALLYWPTFAGLAGFRPGQDPEPGSTAEAFSAGMNDVFERTVGQSLQNIVDRSRWGTELISERELQSRWTANLGNTASACDWVAKAGRYCLVVDATNHHLDAKLAQGLGTPQAYARDIETTFADPGEKFEQLAKSIRRLSVSGQADFGLAADTVFVPLIVVPHGGVPNLDSTDLDLQMRSRPLLQEFDGRILAPAVITLTMLHLIEGISEFFGANMSFPDGIMTLVSWRLACMKTVWPVPFDEFVSGQLPARPIPRRLRRAAKSLESSLRQSYYAKSQRD